MAMRLTLPVKFSLFSMLLTLLGVAVAVSMSFYHSDQLLQAQAQSRLADDLNREQALLDNKLKTLVEDVRFLSDSAAVRGIVRATEGQGYDDQENMTLEMWRARLSDQFRTVLQQRISYTQIRLIGVMDSGREVVRVDRYEDRLMVIPEQDLQQKANRSYFSEAVKLSPEDFYISPVTLNRENGRVVYPPQSVLRIAMPISRDGKVFGILVVNVDFNLFAASFYRAPANIYYFIANANGDFLIHPSAERRMAFEYNRETDFGTLFGFDVRQLAEGESRSVLLEEQAQGLVLSHYHVPMQHTGAGEFYLGAVAELSVLQHQSENLKQDLLALTLVILLVSAGVTFGMGWHITRPILALKRSADRISAGEQSVKVPVSGSDEVASLGASLQQMLNHLGESRLQLAELNRSLEGQVASRTAELESATHSLEQMNHDLEIALSEAEQAAVAKGHFLATMSHEIRTPLNGVLGMTELLLNTTLSNQQRSYLESVQTSGTSLLNLLNDILDYSKLEAGKLTLNRLEFDPNELIEHSLQLFVELAHGKGLELVPVTLPKLQQLVVGDPDRLGQVLMNLVSNAVKFTERGEVVLGLRMLEESDSHLTVQFFVRDTGSGIAEQDQKKLFDEFVQLDGSTTRHHGGTGLGLAIVQQLVGLMDSQIELKSTLGQGSEFSFSVQLPKGRKTSRLDRMGQIVGKRCLVVDDNATNRELLHQMVISWGMSNGSAASGQEALEILREKANRGKPYDLVLLDHMMPGMDGIELSQRIQNEPMLRDCKRLLLTSMGTDVAEEVVKDAGIEVLLPKPLRQSELLNQILIAFDEPALVAETPKTEQNTPTFFANTRVLLVEDTEINQRVTLGMLQNLGIKADLATNGRLALDQVERSDSGYDLILMDVEMPEMDGLESTRILRERAVKTPIVALTAHALRGDREKCLNVGMNDYLTKPLTLKALSGCLQRWVKPQLPAAKQPLAQPDTTQVATTVDRQVLSRLERDLGGDIDEILQCFVDDLPDLIAALERALASKDREALRMYAHRLKGGCRNIGATSLAELAFALEQKSETDPWESVTAKVAKIAELGPEIGAEVSCIIQEGLTA